MFKLKVQNSILWVTVIVLGVAAVVVGSVKAYSGGSVQNLTENGDIIVNNYNKSSDVGTSEDAMIGAAVASDASHLTQEPKPTALSYLFLSNDLEVDGTAYFDGIVYAYNGLSVSTDEILYQGTLGEIVTSGSFADATTTLFCTQNPFSATSTLAWQQAIVSTAATSSFELSYVTSTSAHPTTIYGASFLGTEGVVTSSALMAVSGATFTTGTTGIVVGGIDSYSTKGTGFNNAHPNSTSWSDYIMVDPNDYVCGVVTGYVTDGAGKTTGGITDVGNTFAGTYQLKWIR